MESNVRAFSNSLFTHPFIFLLGSRHYSYADGILRHIGSSVTDLNLFWFADLRPDVLLR